MLTSDTVARPKPNQKHTQMFLNLASSKLCAWRHDMPPPLSSPVGAQVPHAPPSRRNVAVDSHAQYVLVVTAAPASRVKAAVSKAAWWPWHVTFWTWKWCVRVTCDVGYLCANLNLPRTLCSRHSPDVRDRHCRCQSNRWTPEWQMSDVRQHHCLMPPHIRVGHNNCVSAGELSISCTRLLARRVTTLWLSRPLSVSQYGQLSHPSLRDR